MDQNFQLTIALEAKKQIGANHPVDPNYPTLPYEMKTASCKQEEFSKRYRVNGALYQASRHLQALVVLSEYTEKLSLVHTRSRSRKNMIIMI